MKLSPVRQWTLLLSLFTALALAIPAGAKGNFAGQMNRPLRYHPEGTDFVIVNGERLFNRPLYGQHNAFKVQAGDRPEFALFKDAKYGVLKLGIVTPGGSKWLPAAQTVTARYHPGSMIYEITDPLLGAAKLTITVLAQTDADGIVLKADITGSTEIISLVWCYGGLSGEKLQRGGDLIGGADLASIYQLRASDCTGNIVQTDRNSFTLTGPRGAVHGSGPTFTYLGVGDAANLETPAAALQSKAKVAPVLIGQAPLRPGKPAYLGVTLGAASQTAPPEDMARAWDISEKRRDSLAARVVVDTPDPFFNATVGAFSVSADAIWESPHFMHGANAWRTALLGWRGPYAADVWGWHDRARAHFSYWAAKQNTDASDVPTDARPDPAKNLAENDGKTLRSYGAIPAGHYDMAMVYIDELFRHFAWTGDRAYAKQMWPVIKRHLAWEKRNFDRDGLYEAYCAIWASDAMQYNGGGTTHASAYNYWHFRQAARIARLADDNPAPYTAEAARIHAAMQSELWLPREGWYGEYRDIIGMKLLHPAAAVYTIYHTIDSQVPDPLQSYEMLRYVDTQIPHIPVQGPGVPQGSFAVVATSNWLPYQWSLNNVVLAETEHTALAYWQAGQSDAAWRLWMGGMLDSMYLGACPGDIPNLSQYDVNRGESYRDFGDPTGIGARTLIEGLFGILPDALAGELRLRPGFPSAWSHASIRTPDISYSYVRQGTVETYKVTPTFGRPLRLILQSRARLDTVTAVTVNGKSCAWTKVAAAVGAPEIEVQTKVASSYTVVIHWQGAPLAKEINPAVVASGDILKASFGAARVLAIADPQEALTGVQHTAYGLTGTVAGMTGHRTVFAQVRQGNMKWWQPIAFEARPAFEIVPTTQDAAHLRFRVRNNRDLALNQDVTVMAGTLAFRLHAISTLMAVNPRRHITAPAFGLSNEIAWPLYELLPGVNDVAVQGRFGEMNGQVTNWAIPATSTHWDMVNISAAFNDSVTQIFKNNYVSPRSPFTSLEIPIHAIGSWSSPNAMAEIDDTDLRQAAGATGVFTLPQGIPFRTPSAMGAKNIAFTSQWDNYPRSVTVPLTGNAAHAYLLMAGSTEPMQSRLDNGEVVISYVDDGTARLPLNNPVNWWPIDQDYFQDDYAFHRDGPMPPRVLLRTGAVYIPDGTRSSAIPGGAATVLDLPLDPARTLKSITVRTIANDVVIGLMSVTLARPQ